MANITIPCPFCHQQMTCDDQWAGLEIQCPMCHKALIVPGGGGPSIATAAEANNPLVPKPTGAARLSLSAAQAAEIAKKDLSNIPIRNLAPPPKKQKNVLATIAKVLVIVIALGAGGYFGYGWLKDRQQKLNDERREVEKNSDGGQVGHIADLNKVLDATEPGRMGVPPGGRAKGPKQRPSGVGQNIPVASDGSGDAAPAAPENNAPLVPAIYTLEVDAAKIPDGRVNGMVSGTNFVPDTVRIDPVGTAQVLRLVQGQLLAPDREILVYLHLKPGEKLGGQSITVNKDQRGGTPPVMKRWKKDPRYAPQVKSFNFGYAMKLELGQMTNGTMPGKIYIALPDQEQSVAAGTFTVVTAAADAQNPDQPAVNPAMQRYMTPRAGRVAPPERYGVAQ
jgi:hypothetical protein